MPETAATARHALASAVGQNGPPLRYALGPSRAVGAALDVSHSPRARDSHVSLAFQPDAFNVNKAVQFSAPLSF